MDETDSEAVLFELWRTLSKPLPFENLPLPEKKPAKMQDKKEKHHRHFSGSACGERGGTCRIHSVFLYNHFTQSEPAAGESIGNIITSDDEKDSDAYQNPIVPRL